MRMTMKKVLLVLVVLTRAFVLVIPAAVIKMMEFQDLAKQFNVSGVPQTMVDFCRGAVSGAHAPDTADGGLTPPRLGNC
jgi:hypothetical protein